MNVKKIVIMMLLFITGASFKLLAETQNRDLPSFNKIKILGNCKVTVYQSNEHKIVIHASKNTINRIRTEVKNGELKIDHVRIPLVSWFSDHNIRYDIYAPDIQAIRLGGNVKLVSKKLSVNQFECHTSGSSEVEIDYLQADKCSLKISGSGDIEIEELITDKIKCDIAGSGKITTSGCANKARFEISGSGSYDCEELQTEDVLIKITGSGKADVWATQRIGFEITGSGNIKFYGKPEILRNNIIGSGSIDSKGYKETRKCGPFKPKEDIETAPVPETEPEEEPSRSEFGPLLKEDE